MKRGRARTRHDLYRGFAATFVDLIQEAKTIGQHQRLNELSDDSRDAGSCIS